MHTAAAHIIRRIVLPAAFAALLSAGYAHAQVTVRNAAARTEQAAPAANPKDLFLTAHRLMGEASVLAKKQSYYAAIQRAQEAERILATIVRDFPNWEVRIVRDKRSLLASQLAEYRSHVNRSTIPTNRPTDAPVSINDPGDFTGRQGHSLPNYATADKQLYQRIANLEEELRRVAEAYSKLNTRHKDVLQQLTQAQKEKAIYEERYNKLVEQVAHERVVGNQVIDSLSSRLKDAEAKYQTAQNALRDSEVRVAQLETDLSAMQEALTRVTRERDSLLDENEKLRAVLELNSPEKTKALLDQNLTLAEQLKTARERIKELEAIQSGTNDENAVLARQLDEARAEAGRLRDEMAGIYDENMGFRRRISELTQELNHLEADLAARAEQPTVDPAVLEENALLLSIIERQRRTITMQEESRRLLFETYRALKKDDPEVMAILKRMQEDDFQALTEEELKVLEDVRNGVHRDNPEAEAAARRKLELETLVGLANKAFSKGRYISAEQLYMTLYDRQPDNVAGLVNLGTILLYNNKNEEATQFLMRASRLAPDLAIGHYLAGIAYYRQELMQDAQRMFARALQLDPGNAEAFFYLANIEGLTGDYARALKHYAAAVKIKPELADAHYNMARLYAETGRIPEAARSYDRAMESGSMPDPEFDNYLRHHPDNAKKPGTDLVVAVKPEDEARSLRDVAGMEPAAEPATPVEPNAEAAFREAVQQTAVPVAAAPTPSPAGSGHEYDPALLSTTKVRRGGATHTVRVKKAQPRRVRTRGADDTATVRQADRRG